MKRVCILLFGLALVCSSAWSQVTYNTVTATVTDPNGKPYANAAYVCTLINAAGYPVSSVTTPNGQLFNAKPVSGFLDATGFMSVGLVPNGILSKPSGTQWRITISAPTDTAILTYQSAWTVNYPVTISSDVDLSAQLSSLTQPIAYVNLRSGQSTIGGGALPAGVTSDGSNGLAVSGTLAAGEALPQIAIAGAGLGTSPNGTALGNAMLDSRAAAPMSTKLPPKKLANVLSKCWAGNQIVVLRVGTSIEAGGESGLASALVAACGRSTATVIGPANGGGVNGYNWNGWWPQLSNSLGFMRYRGTGAAVYGSTGVPFTPLSGARSFTLIYDQEPDGGTGAIVVDGGASTPVNWYSATSKYAQYITVALDPSKNHYITITPPASGFGYYTTGISGSIGNGPARGVLFVEGAVGGKALSMITGSALATAGVGTTATITQADGSSSSPVAAGSHTFTPGAMTGIVVGTKIALGYGAGLDELVSVTAVTGSTFTATTLLSHALPFTIRASSGTGTSAALNLPQVAPNGTAGITALLSPPAGSPIQPDVFEYWGATNDAGSTFTTDLATLTTAIVNASIPALYVMEPAHGQAYVGGVGLYGGLATGTTDWETKRLAFYVQQNAQVTPTSNPTGKPVNASDFISIYDWDYEMKAQQFNPDYHDTALGNPHPGDYYGYGEPHEFAFNQLAAQLGLPSPRSSNMAQPAVDQLPRAAAFYSQATEPQCAPPGSSWSDTSVSTPLLKVKIAGPSLTVAGGCGPGVWRIEQGSPLELTGGLAGQSTFAPYLQSFDGGTNNLAVFGASVNPIMQLANWQPATTYTLSFVVSGPPTSTSHAWVQDMGVGSSSGGVYKLSYDPTQRGFFTAAALNGTVSPATYPAWNQTTAVDPLTTSASYAAPTITSRYVLTFTTPTQATLTTAAGAGVLTSNLYIYMAVTNVTISDLRVDLGASVGIASPYNYTKIQAKYAPVSGGLPAIAATEPTGTGVLLNTPYKDTSSAAGTIVKSLISQGAAEAVMPATNPASGGLYLLVSGPGGNLTSPASWIAGLSGTSNVVGTVTLGGYSVSANQGVVTATSGFSGTAFTSSSAPVNAAGDHMTFSWLHQTQATLPAASFRLQMTQGGTSYFLQSNGTFTTTGPTSTIGIPQFCDGAWHRLVLPFVTPVGMTAGTATFTLTFYPYYGGGSSIGDTFNEADFSVEFGTGVTVGNPEPTFLSAQLQDQGQCTMAAGACPAQTLKHTYAAAPQCLGNWTGSGTFTGVLKMPSTTITTTPASSVGTDTGVVNWACVGK